MPKRVCHEIHGLAFPIQLVQVGRDNFTTVYGKEVKQNITYAEAGAAYGLAIMHALACDGKLDNREPRRRHYPPKHQHFGAYAPGANAIHAERLRKAGLDIRHDVDGYYVLTLEEAANEDDGHASAGFDGRPHFTTLAEAYAHAMKAEG